MQDQVKSTKRAVVVTGGRAYADAEKVRETLSSIPKHFVLYQGGAKGADELARLWCYEVFNQCVTYDAAWHYYGKSAGPMRNRLMLKEAASRFGAEQVLLIAFPGGRGTQNCVNEARKLGIEICHVE